ncbi:Hsp70 domain containing protein [Rhypophila sp. PSN 637]
MAEEPPQKSWSIGIDFGTANTRVAVFRNDKVEIIPDVDGNPSMPSCVSFTDFGRLVGSATRSQHAANPTNTVFDIKRLVGRAFSDAEVQAMIKHFPFRVADHGGKPVIQVQYMGSAMTLTVVEILSMILARAKENAEAYLGSRVESAVISIPTYWFTEQRNIVLGAAEIAGIKVQHLTAGPFAVAIAYAHTLKPNTGERNVLIVDQGAGMFNTAVVCVEEGIVEIKSIAGDMHLGGEDLVNRLVNHMVQQEKITRKKDLVSMHNRVLRRLRTACEVAVRELSSASQVSIEVDSLYEGRDFYSSIKRSRFEELCQDLFRSILNPIDRALSDAKMDKSAVHEIILVGGCVRIPKIQKILSVFFNGKELNRRMHPDEAEVSGLAIQASILNGDTSSRSAAELLLLEALPISLGVQNDEGLMEKLVPRNTTVPTKKSEIITIYDSFTSYRQLSGSAHMAIIKIIEPRVKFYEGERRICKDNRPLGTMIIPQNFMLSGGVTKFECSIKIDAHFRAWATLTELSTGRTINARLCDSYRLDAASLHRFKEDAARYKAIDDKQGERANARDALERRIATLLQSFEEACDGSPGLPEDVFIKDCLTQLSQWVDENLDASIEEYIEQERVLDGIEESIKIWRTRLKTRKRKASQSSYHHRPSQTLRRRLLSPLWSLPFLPSRRPFPSLFPRTRNGMHLQRNLRKTRKRRKARKSSHHQRPIVPKPVVEDLEFDVTTEISKNNKEWKKGKQVDHTPNYETLETLLSRSVGSINNPFSDSEFERISTFLRNNTELPAAWSNVPRLYTVLRLIDQLDVMEAFLLQGMTDIWFPFTNSTLPSVLPPSLQSKFLEAQPVVLSKGFKLEKGTDRKHALFSADEPLPFQAIGRLGRGAHGSVDKVMSTISHREYARKLFKKRKGLRQEDIRTFKTELEVLKRVQHWHCVELHGSYSDPRYFALLMQPVGDCNLADYYHKARGNPDMLSLLRSFFGCLANAMQYLHSARIRHRDIKPQNIIVKVDRVLLADFGIAYSWENLTRGTTTADSSKTLVYAAPEVVRVEARNESADIWSLGCVFLEMATVLKEETVGNMREMFHMRSDSYCFHANVEAMGIWVARLKEIHVNQAGGNGDVAENLPLEWAMSMLQVVPGKRPTAAKLFEDIVDECAAHGVLFGGPCCHDGGAAVAADSTCDEEEEGDPWGEDEEDGVE